VLGDAHDEALVVDAQADVTADVWCIDRRELREVVPLAGDADAALVHGFHRAHDHV